MAGSILSGPVSKHKKYLINLTTIVNLMITTQETIKNVIKNNRKNIRKSQITFKNLDLRSDITNQMFLSPIRSRHIRFPYPSYSAHIICMQPPPLTNHIFTLMNQPIPLLTPQSFCDLLTNNSKINDSTIQSFLHWLCSTPPMMTFIIYVPASAKTCYNKGGSMLSTNISFMNSA
jgi:hypothetical protein